MDLAPLMDPLRLMENAADLNLRLMKWRALPQLDVALLAATKVLCVGAGTLGCQVARTLLGWGVKTVNFVDSGRVSFSNPTRQCLFEFADCLDGGKFKADAAAAALRRIFPAVHSAGFVLSIPMPGHALGDGEAATAAAATAQLEALVEAHDVVFLLTDTRESRWLPTLLCAAHDTCLINVALGMDSYLVGRHGGAPPAHGHDAKRLGCYFCNDAVAVSEAGG
jgi:ubiquitin-like modifier-activating enzyme ATG7